METKTNVMRLLDQQKILYKSHCYADSNAISGTEVAAALGKNIDMVFKTLVTCGKSQKNFVFVIPAAEELDLKKAAAAVNEKALEMLKMKQLLPLTGYIHGGCSPIGMKKTFETIFHSTAANFDTIIFSAGKIGWQIEISLTELKKILNFTLCDITK